MEEELKFAKNTLVQKYVRKQGKLLSRDFTEGLNEKIKAEIDKSIIRATENKRKTVTIRDN